MSKELLIVFIKNAVEGQVKTRLAASVGNRRALHVYNQLLQHTFRITSVMACEKRICYSSFIPAEDEWKKAGFASYIQEGDDLGARMKNAFDLAFDDGYAKVIVIGSDCYELTTKVIQMAFDILVQKDVVVGPARDGGYYLLGMNEMQSMLFRNKAWSTPCLFTQTVNDLQGKGLSFGCLPLLSDVDEEKDLETISHLLL